MALSNIRNEPRREITETVLGIGIVVVPLVLLGYLDHLAASWLANKGTSYFEWLVLGPLCLMLGVSLLFFAGAVLSGVALLVHVAGEAACDALEHRGIHLRPRQRYGQGCE